MAVHGKPGTKHRLVPGYLSKTLRGKGPAAEAGADVVYAAREMVAGSKRWKGRGGMLAASLIRLAEDHGRDAVQLARDAGAPERVIGIIGLQVAARGKKEVH